MISIACSQFTPLLFSGKRRYNVKLWKTFTDCFNCLPVAAIIDEKIFCCHGGLSPGRESLGRRKTDNEGRARNRKTDNERRSAKSKQKRRRRRKIWEKKRTGKKGWEGWGRDWKLNCGRVSHELLSYPLLFSFLLPSLHPHPLIILISLSLSLSLFLACLPRST